MSANRRFLSSQIRALRARHVHTVHPILTKLCKYIALIWDNNRTKFQTQRTYRF